jgi:toxin ParE1/3/4
MQRSIPCGRLPQRDGKRVDVEVLLAPTAIEDLDDIHRYIADHADDATADAYLARIARCRSIGGAPMIGTPRDDLIPGLRTVPFERRATIAYFVSGRVVTIQRVLHAGRDLIGGF